MAVMKSEAQHAQQQARFDRYERRTATPLLINGFLFLAAFVVMLTNPEPFASWLLQGTWLVFIADYAMMFILAPDRLRWAVQHIHLLIALLFPPLRIALLVMLALRVMRSKNSPLRNRVGILAVYITGIVVVFGAYFVWRLEHNAPGANIRSYGESLWWAVVTITTVGYGDYVPVTVGGRLVAVIMLFNGIAGIAVLSGVVVSYFTSDSRRNKPAGMAGRAADLIAGTTSDDDRTTPNGGQATLATIEQRLRSLEELLQSQRHSGARSAEVSDAVPTIDGQQPGTRPAGEYHDGATSAGDHHRPGRPGVDEHEEAG